MPQLRICYTAHIRSSFHLAFGTLLGSLFGAVSATPVPRLLCTGRLCDAETETLHAAALSAKSLG